MKSGLVWFQVFEKRELSKMNTRCTGSKDKCGGVIRWNGAVGKELEEDA